MATTYVRAVGKPRCHYGKECFRANLRHWSDYDHPPDHPRLTAGADFGLPPVPSPMPVCIDISASDDEDAGHVSARPEGTGLVDRGRAGLIHFRIASSGPQELQAQRRQIADGVAPQLLLASTGVCQDGASAAAAAAAAVTAAAAAAAAAATVAAPPPEATPSVSTTFYQAITAKFDELLKVGQSEGYSRPAEPLVIQRNLDALMRLYEEEHSDQRRLVVVVCGEGMNKASNHLLDRGCASGEVVVAALERALQGSKYLVANIVATDVCLGYHPVTGAQPNDKNIEHGFRLNMMFINMLIKYEFSVVVVCIGLAASKKLYPALKLREDIIVTCTYHAVLVSNDQRNGYTTNAARLSVAAAARLVRLAVDFLHASEVVPPTLEEACAKALTPFHSYSFT